MVARALVIDDEPEMCEMLAMALADLDVEVRTATSAQDGLDLLAREAFGVVLTDVSMPVMDGLQLCSRVAQVQPGVPVIVVTGRGDLDTAIGAMRAGAYDFLVKPVDIELLSLVVARALQHNRLRAEVKRLRAVVDATTGPPDIVGTSAPMRRVHETIARILDSEATVVICGETGTGKELVARAHPHARAARSAGPFVAINCAAVPRALLESELFGHVRGAFTDAQGSAQRPLRAGARAGRCSSTRSARCRSEMQAKLLRALEERRVRPVGANDEMPFDVADRGRDEPRPGRGGRGEALPRGPVLPHQRGAASSCRRCARAAGDVLALAQHFLAQLAARHGARDAGLSAPRRREAAGATAGRATSASCGTASSAPWRWRGSTRSRWTICRSKVRDYKHGALRGGGQTTPTEIVHAGRGRAPLRRARARRCSAATSRARPSCWGLDRRTLYRRIERWGVRL